MVEASMSTSGRRDESSLSNVEHLAWRSLRTLILLGLPEVERTFRHYGIVQLEYQTLVELYDARKGVRMGELAAALQVSPSRLSHRMEKLTRSGLVALEATGDDARGTLAVVTNTGRALVDRLTAVHEDAVRRVLFTPLQPQQVRALADSLSTIAAALTPTDGAVPVDTGDFETETPPPPPPPPRRRWRGPLLKEWPRRA